VCQKSRNALMRTPSKGNVTSKKLTPSPKSEDGLGGENAALVGKKWLGQKELVRKTDGLFTDKTPHTRGAQKKGGAAVRNKRGKPSKNR